METVNSLAASFIVLCLAMAFGRWLLYSPLLNVLKEQYADIMRIPCEGLKVGCEHCWRMILLSNVCMAERQRIRTILRPGKANIQEMVKGVCN